MTPILAALWMLVLWVFVPALRAQTADFDLAPFARRCCVRDQNASPLAFDYAEAREAGPGAEKSADGRFIYGLQWTEERDFTEVRVTFKKAAEPVPATVEYWFRNWPYPPPRMPSMEDPVDDPWQGQWLSASTKVDCRTDMCRYTFLPLTEQENPAAKNLPGLTYRRALKMRLVFASEPALAKVQVFSGTTERSVGIRLELGVGETAAHTWDGSLRIYNGRLVSVHLPQESAGDSASTAHFHVVTKGSAKSLVAALVTTRPALPGSSDLTVVTLRAADRSFSFALPDLEKGPIYVPDFHVYVALASYARHYSPSMVKRGQRIRERLLREPEQTYERASEEIPALDPADREWPSRLFLPLAADASWQKFAFEWGGNIYISKEGTKAKGNELKRLDWDGDRLQWWMGTGAPPQYRPGWKDSRLSVLEDDLPVVTAQWTTSGIEYSEEAFATLLSGPLDPDDPQRSEQTPAVLMVKLTAHNPGAGQAMAHVWMATSPSETLTYRDGQLLALDGRLVRAFAKLAAASTISTETVMQGNLRLTGVHANIPLAPDETRSVCFSLPFIPKLSPQERTQLAALDFAAERERVVNYWRSKIDGTVPFTVPEARFNTFARAVIPHIRISATKDPASGLYMVPAASYGYQVYANEAAFQCAMLDALGDHKLATEYLATPVKLQGSRAFQGTYTGDQSAVYHGARVNADYDYTASEYNLDHGTVLWALAEHYLYTRDKDWLQQVATSMKKAADWVIEQRKATTVMDNGEKVPEYGLLPAGHLEDNSDWGYWFSVNAYAAIGMTRLGEALADVGDPDAARYSGEAAAYTQDLRDAVMRAAQSSPVFRLRDNTYVPWFAPRPYERFRLFGPIRVAYYTRYPQKVAPLYRLSATRENLYGPMILLTMNIFHPEEAVARWVLDDWEDNATTSVPMGLNVHGWVDEQDWFSRGGMVFQANLQNPTLTYLRRHEIPAELRSLYNDFAACLYPDVNAFTEEYHQWVHGSGPFYKVPDESRFVNRLRDMLVLEEGDSLWIASGVPRRWLAAGEKIDVHNLATFFGPITYHLEGQEDQVTASVELPARNPSKSAVLVLRVPGGKPLRSVEIDGQAWKDFDAAQGWVRLPLRPGTLQVVARY